MSAAYVYPTPPPTTNALDKEQRTRLLRSTRKLGAVLGTTPFLLEPDLAEQPRVPPSPRTAKAHRRQASIFYDPSSSGSSVDLSADYILVKGGGPTSPYQIQALPFQFSSSSSLSLLSSRGSSLDLEESQPSPAISKSRARALPPINISLDLPGSQLPLSEKAKGKRKLGAAQQPLAQPLLLRLRSVPVASTDNRVQQQTTQSDKRDSSASSLFGTKRRSRSISVMQAPLSPLSPTFGANTPTAASPPPMTTERERRRKMAKLTRTLGENIPPELVFGPMPAKPTGPRMRAVSPPTSSAHPVSTSSRSRTSSPLPPLPHLQPRKHLPALPAPAPTSAKRKHRPRRLTLDAAAHPPTRSTSYTAASAGRKPQHVPSQSDSMTMAREARHHANSSSSSSESKLPSGPRDREEVEEWRRKEREWSGEWNVRDMGDVVSALRGLRVR